MLLDAHADSHTFNQSERCEIDSIRALFKALPTGCPEGWVDVRKVAAWQTKGVDFLLPNNLTLDFKAETYDGWRCAAELISSDRPNYKPGWLFTSRANWIVHLFATTGQVICLPLNAYRNAVLAKMAKDRAYAKDGTYACERWVYVSVVNGSQSADRVNYVSYCALLESMHALKLPGAFRCQFPAAKRDKLLDIPGLPEAVPLEQFALRLLQDPPAAPEPWPDAYEFIMSELPNIQAKDIKKNYPWHKRAIGDKKTVH